jgi:hypothetical protein
LEISAVTRTILIAVAASLGFAAATGAAPAGQDSGHATSPDGQTRVSIRTEAHESTAPAGGPTNSLWISRAGRAERRLIGPHTGRDAEHQFQSFNHPTFSLDGRFVYVVADAWVTSGAAHQIDTVTGKERYVTSANDLRVVRSGPYRGDLLVRQHRYHPGGGSYDPLVLVRPDGKVLLQTVPGAGGDSEDHDDDGRAWLKQHAAEAW